MSIESEKLTATIDHEHLENLLREERQHFVETHAKSLELYERAQNSLLAGVPMPWMSEWAGPFPMFVAEAEGERITDVDGHTYFDFCYGDTGAMTGHSPRAALDAIARQAARGITFIMPTEDSIAVGEELGRRFRVPYWQFCLSATDANRFTLRHARQLTGRPKVLVFNWCYHGSVDEALAVLENGAVVRRPGNIGSPVDPAQTTRVVEFNDVDGLEEALRHEDVACVLAEPFLTNMGFVLPDPGFHDALRELTRRFGTYLVLDETQTICAGPGGATGAWELEPDFVTIGKPLASGVPIGCYGMSEEVAYAILSKDGELLKTSDVGGVGGTLSGNALSLAVVRATLEKILTPEAFAAMTPLAAKWTRAAERSIEAHNLPWHVQQVGCRAEYWFSPTPPRTGGEAVAVADPTLAQVLHIYALNRGVLITPFVNATLLSPSSSVGSIETYSRVFDESLQALLLGG
jgi:glutamate-1-semialdehyde 2,1-aminomutase